MKTYFKRRGWKDSIFLSIVLMLGVLFGRHFYGLGLGDIDKWNRRTQPDPGRTVGTSLAPGQSGLAPCFFILPGTSVNQPQESGDVGDCLLLTPDGKRLDLFEIAVLGSGFMHVRTDLYVPGVVAIALTRVTSRSSEWSERNGAYLRHVYDPFLSGSRFPYTYSDWLLPDGQSIHFNRISPGSGFGDAVFESVSKDPLFAGSRMNWNGFGWDLTLSNGTTYLSPEAYDATRAQQGSLVGIFDEKGNEIKLSRAANGDLKEIKSPQGGWIRLRYDGQERVTRADCSTGEFVKYGYDANDRLTEVKYSSGEITEYRYDSSNRLVSVKDAAESVSLQPVYGQVGMSNAIGINAIAGYVFSRTVDLKSRTVNVEIAGPKGRKTRIRIPVDDDSFRYSVEASSRSSARN
jgi:YD repeat-containing protein